MRLLELQAMRGELEKQSAAEDIPWYTTAAGATGGVLAAQKFLPKKYKGIGQIGGALLGTGAGLAVGKPLTKKLEKKAEAWTLDEWAEHFAGRIKEAVVKEKKPDHTAKTLAKSVAGLGAGMAAGYLGMKGADKGLKAMGGKGLPKGGKLRFVVPAAAGAVGMAAPYLHQRTLEKMRADHLKRQEKKSERKGS